MFKKTLLACAILTSLHTLAAAETTNSPREDYLIYMNPFVVSSYEENAIKGNAENSKIPKELLENNDSALTDYININTDSLNYSEGKEQVKSELIKEFSIEFPGETISFMPAFSAKLTEEEVNKLRESNKVNAVEKIEAIENDDAFKDAFSSTAYNDTQLGQEIIPWAKQAVNAHDDITTNNIFYLVDSSFESPALESEINFKQKQTSDSGNTHHATSVLSLAVGKKNNKFSIGINPGQPVVHYALGSSYSQNLVQQIGNAAKHAEAMGIFSTLNISINHRSNSLWNNGGAYKRAFLQASSRLFITQSAGNDGENCSISTPRSFIADPEYSKTDGIMVVGGLNKYNQPFSNVFNPNFENSNNQPIISNDYKASSNFGSCIDVWAPGQDIYTYNAPGFAKIFTGTSYSAPIVSAIAGRYGDHKTRPIEREQYIRASMVNTGNFDGSGATIYKALYKKPSDLLLPERIRVTSVSTDRNENNLARVIDERFYDPIIWNSGSNNANVVFNLPGLHDVRGLRGVIKTNSEGFKPIRYNVFGALTKDPKPVFGPSSVTPYTKLHNEKYLGSTTVNYLMDGAPFFIPINGNYQYIRLEAASSSVPVSYAEVELFGFKK